MAHLRRSRGLMICSKARPTRKKARDRRVIPSPGGRSHQYARMTSDCWIVESIVPQLGVLMSPRPRKLRAASKRIAPLTAKVMYRKTSGMTFGARWRNMIRTFDAPDRHAARLPEHD